MISKAAAIVGKGGACFLSIALVAPLSTVDALAQSPDAGDVSLRLRRAAQAMAAAEEEVTELDGKLKTERSRVVKTEVERELNRETIAHLDKMLAAAKIRLAERKQEFEGAQKALGTNGYTCATNGTLEGFFESTASTARFTLN